MTVSYFALYQIPDDLDDFEKRYATVHGKLVEKTPGLLENRVHSVMRQFVGKPAYHLITEFVFESPDALGVALESPEWAAAWAELQDVGGADLVTMFAAEPHGAGATSPS
jgi:uncharacterized protein (TIGR02118 family)